MKWSETSGPLRTKVQNLLKVRCEGSHPNQTLAADTASHVRFLLYTMKRRVMWGVMTPLDAAGSFTRDLYWKSLHDIWWRGKVMQSHRHVSAPCDDCSLDWSSANVEWACESSRARSRELNGSVWMFKSVLSQQVNGLISLHYTCCYLLLPPLFPLFLFNGHVLKLPTMLSLIS